MTDTTIRAAGGVVWRMDGEDMEIVLVHRPKYDDWSLPKGKLDPGETWEDAAIREVREETGLDVELGRPLGEVEYLVQHSKTGGHRPKMVRYWAMRAVGGSFTPHKEIDAVRWVSPRDAFDALSHVLDRETVHRFLKLCSPSPS